MGRVQSVFSGADGRRSLLERRRFVLFLSIFALILLVVNVSGWRVYAAMQRTFEDELGERLETIAAAAARPIDGDYIREIDEDPDGAFGTIVVRDQFERLHATLAVANLVLLHPDGYTLLDFNRTTPPGEPHPLSVLHPDAFMAARSGIASTSGLYSSLGTRYKNGYAPVLDAGGEVIGVVVVEAGADFFESLEQIRRVVLLAGAASVAAIVALGAIFLRILRMQARLDETMRRTETLSLMGEMAGSVAHEIKNPLGIIRASAERIRKRHGTGEAIFDYIPEEVDRLDAILGAYLDFARRGGRVDGSCMIEDVVENALRLVRRDLEGAGVEVIGDVSPGLAVGIAAGGLQQVLLNLVLNARQAMADGGTLRISGRPGGSRHVLVVSDTGAGIPREDLDRIFQPFQSGRERGSGLGLAIAQRIVTDAGGTIAVESEPGVGTSFTIHLPQGPGLIGPE